MKTALRFAVVGGTGEVRVVRLYRKGETGKVLRLHLVREGWALRSDGAWIDGQNQVWREAEAASEVEEP